MRVGIILQINVPEGAWNAIRFGTAALKEGHEVKIFLISAGVEVESIEHEKYNVSKQIGVLLHELFVRQKVLKKKRRVI